MLYRYRVSGNCPSRMVASVGATPLIASTALVLPASGEPPQSVLTLQDRSYLPVEKKNTASDLISAAVAALPPQSGFVFFVKEAWPEVKAPGTIWASSFSKMTAGPTQPEGGLDDR